MPVRSSNERARSGKGPAQRKAVGPSPKTRKKTASKTAKSAGSRKESSRRRAKDDELFVRVRALCLALPDTKLTMTWGSPHFRVGEKIFCGFGDDGGKATLGVKLEMSHARAIVKDPRFSPAPYVGKHGWVSMDLARRKSWDEVAALIRESYELVAPRASRAKIR